MTPTIPYILLLAFALGSAIWANILLCKSSKEIRKAKDNLANANSEIGELKNRLRQSDWDFSTLYSAIVNGAPLYYDYREEPSRKRICVVAVYQTLKDANVAVCVKAYPIADDPDFAHREAQELLDHLNEK